MEDAREARRKRLLNRGTDRLAFITGQVRSFPSDATAAASAAAAAAASVASLPDEINNQISASTVENTNREETPPLSSAPPEIQTINKISADKAENETVKQETNNYSTKEPLPTLVTCRTTTGIASKTSCGVVTPSQISHSVSASENIRILCSVIIALLVLLSRSAVGSITNWRPFLLVLLTDASVVIGRILLNKETEPKGKNGAKSGNGWGTDAGQMLEAAMLFKKVVGAVTMDCSICAVIMISGLL